VYKFVVLGFVVVTSAFYRIVAVDHCCVLTTIDVVSNSDVTAFVSMTDTRYICDIL